MRRGRGRLLLLGDGCQLGRGGGVERQASGDLTCCLASDAYELSIRRLRPF